jgi:hypothetical protein
MLKKQTMKKITIILLTILTLSSCETGEKDQIITIGDKYSVSIPSFLTKVNNLNDDASLQYQHAWKEFYVIVIDESIEEMQKALEDNDLTESYTNDVKGYSNLLLDGFEQTVSVKRKSEILDTLVNGMPARLLTINGRIEGIDAFYSLAFIQGKERYYQIMAWTLSNKEYQYKDRMNDIIYTLKEISK